MQRQCLRLEAKAAAFAKAARRVNMCEDSVCEKVNSREDSVFVGASQVFFTSDLMDDSIK